MVVSLPIICLLLGAVVVALVVGVVVGSILRERDDPIVRLAKRDREKEDGPPRNTGDQ
jgi:hypothetical protein